ncbi:MAG: chemotaxis-specific protein-glutamate methyltransferase CheB [bacterium]|nr:chemotaxis-specific protein-glutamate methyltransferase CheB [bacterium]
MGLRALVIEDSLVFQKIMAEVLRGLPGVETVDVAGRGDDGLAAAGRHQPDVVFLDLHLPDMDGLDVLDRLKARWPRLKVVVVSGLSIEGADLTIAALSRGAQQFVRKPAGSGFQQSVAMLRAELEPVVGTVRAQLAPAPVPPRPVVPSPASSPRANAAGRPHGAGFWVTAIAVSTGGPEALSRLVPRLPAGYPMPVVIVQHMPPLFTLSLARSLDAKSALTVVEAADGDVLKPGTVYLAPGGRHLTVVREGAQSVCRLNDDPPEQSVRPAADVLFRSLARIGGTQRVLAVVMTGMGEDGLAGVRQLKAAGGWCLTQAETTCVVYGMPRAIDTAGLNDESVALDDLAGRLASLANCGRAPAGV